MFKVGPGERGKIFVFFGDGGSIGVKAATSREEADEWLLRYPEDARVSPQYRSVGLERAEHGRRHPRRRAARSDRQIVRARPRRAAEETSEFRRGVGVASVTAARLPQPAGSKRSSAAPCAASSRCSATLPGATPRASSLCSLTAARHILPGPQFGDAPEQIGPSPDTGKPRFCASSDDVSRRVIEVEGGDPLVCRPVPQRSRARVRTRGTVPGSTSRSRASRARRRW